MLEMSDGTRMVHCVLYGFYYIGPFRTSEESVYSDKFSVIINALQMPFVYGLSRYYKFCSRQVDLRRHRRHFLPRVKTGQNRLNKQKCVFLVNQFL